MKEEREDVIVLNKETVRAIVDTVFIQGATYRSSVDTSKSIDQLGDELEKKMQGCVEAIFELVKKHQLEVSE